MFQYIACSETHQIIATMYKCLRISILISLTCVRAHLTNDDFRRLLMTPKPQAADDSAERPPKREPVETPKSDTKKAKKKK